MKEAQPSSRENPPEMLRDIAERQAIIRQMLSLRGEHLKKLQEKQAEYDKIFNDLERERKELAVIAAIPEKQKEAVSRLERIAEYLDNVRQIINGINQEIVSQIESMEALYASLRELAALYSVLYQGYENYKNLPKA